MALLVSGQNKTQGQKTQAKNVAMPLLSMCLAQRIDFTLAYIYPDVGSNMLHFLRYIYLINILEKMYF